MDLSRLRVSSQLLLASSRSREQNPKSVTMAKAVIQ
jgi:hypothetical protein